MPPKSDRPITKRGINFYDEDITRLQAFFPPRRINKVVRELVHRWLNVVETRAVAKSGVQPTILSIDLDALDALDPEEIKREVERQDG